MNVDEIRAMNDEALFDELDDQKEQLYMLRFQKATGQLEDANLIRYARRNIARIRTVLRERELARELTAKEGKKS